MTFIDNLLKEVIHQAKALTIPISDVIEERVVINGRARKRFGCCRKVGGNYIIEISEVISKGPKESIIQILAHEILHTCPRCQNHGEAWKNYARQMNQEYGYQIRRTSTLKDMGVELPEGTVSKGKTNYIVQCKGCGQKIERVRKSKLIKNIHLYRCSCGSKLELLK